MIAHQVVLYTKNGSIANNLNKAKAVMSGYSNPTLTVDDVVDEDMGMYNIMLTVDDMEEFDELGYVEIELVTGKIVLE